MQDRQPLQYNSISENDDPNHDIFTDPTLNRTLKEDPLVQFLFKWWRQVLMIVVAAFAVFYIKEAFHSTYVTSMQRSAELYTNVQAQYVAFNVLKQEEKTLKASEKEKTEDGLSLADLQNKISETKGKLQDMLVALKEAREPYSEFATIYTALIDLADGKSDTLLAYKDALKWSSLKASSNQRFFSEIVSLTEARVLLDEPGREAEGKDLLYNLATNGVVVNVPAAVTLANIVESPEDSAKVLAIMKGIQSKSPKQTVLLEGPISKLEQRAAK